MNDRSTHRLHTPATAAKRLREMHGVDLSADAIRWRCRLGRLPTVGLVNGWRVLEEETVDALGVRLARAQHDARHVA